MSATPHAEPECRTQQQCSDMPSETPNPPAVDHESPPDNPIETYEPPASRAAFSAALPNDRPLFAVVDVEAIVLNRRSPIVEQVAVGLYDEWGTEWLAEKHMIRQVMSAEEIASSRNMSLDAVNYSMRSYARVTGDSPVHDGSQGEEYEDWRSVRKHLLTLLLEVADCCFAKGVDLEVSVFNGCVAFYDLCMFGCPKYKYKPHDPLKEVRFFTPYIPFVQMRACTSASVPIASGWLLPLSYLPRKLVLLSKTQVAYDSSTPPVPITSQALDFARSICTSPPR